MKNWTKGTWFWTAFYLLGIVLSVLAPVVAAMYDVQIPRPMP